MKNLSDILTRISDRTGLRKAVGIGLTGAILCGTPGCASLQNMTKAQKTTLVGQTMSALGELGVSTSKKPTGAIISGIVGVTGDIVTNQGMLKHELEVAETGRDQIVINNNPPTYQNPNQNNYNQPNNYNNSNNYHNTNDNSTPQGLFMYKNYVDFDNNGLVNRNDLVGLNESVYDLRNLEDVKFSFYGGGAFEGVSLDLKIYSLETGKMINFFTGTASGSEIRDFKCNSVLFPKSGKYRAVLNTGNKNNFSLDFEVMK